MIYLLRESDIISVPHMPQAYITARSAISFHRYITRYTGTDIIEKTSPKTVFSRTGGPGPPVGAPDCPLGRFFEIYRLLCRTAGYRLRAGALRSPSFVKPHGAAAEQIRLTACPCLVVGLRRLLGLAAPQRLRRFVAACPRFARASPRFARRYARFARAAARFARPIKPIPQIVLSNLGYFVFSRFVPIISLYDSNTVIPAKGTS